MLRTRGTIMNIVRPVLLLLAFFLCIGVHGQDIDKGNISWDTVQSILPCQTLTYHIPVTGVLAETHFSFTFTTSSPWVRAYVTNVNGQIMYLPGGTQTFDFSCDVQSEYLLVVQALGAPDSQTFVASRRVDVLSVTPLTLGAPYEYQTTEYLNVQPSTDATLPTVLRFLHYKMTLAPGTAPLAYLEVRIDATASIQANLYSGSVASPITSTFPNFLTSHACNNASTVSTGRNTANLVLSATTSCILQGTIYLSIALQGPTNYTITVRQVPMVEIQLVDTKITASSSGLVQGTLEYPDQASLYFFTLTRTEATREMRLRLTNVENSNTRGLVMHLKRDRPCGLNTREVNCTATQACIISLSSCDITNTTYYLSVSAGTQTSSVRGVTFALEVSTSELSPTSITPTVSGPKVSLSSSVQKAVTNHYVVDATSFADKTDTSVNIVVYSDAIDSPVQVMLSPFGPVGSSSCLNSPYSDGFQVFTCGPTTTCFFQLAPCHLGTSLKWHMAVYSANSPVFDRGSGYTIVVTAEQPEVLAPADISNFLRSGSVYYGEYKHYIIPRSLVDNNAVNVTFHDAPSSLILYVQTGSAAGACPCFSSIVSGTVNTPQAPLYQWQPSTFQCSPYDGGDVYVSVRNNLVVSPNSVTPYTLSIRASAPRAWQDIRSISKTNINMGMNRLTYDGSIYYRVSTQGWSTSKYVTITVRTEVPIAQAFTLYPSEPAAPWCSPPGGLGVRQCTLYEAAGENYAGHCTFVLTPCDIDLSQPYYIMSVQGGSYVVGRDMLIGVSVGDLAPVSLTNGVPLAWEEAQFQPQLFSFEARSVAPGEQLVVDIYTNFAQTSASLGTSSAYSLYYAWHNSSSDRTASNQLSAAAISEYTCEIPTTPALLKCRDNNRRCTFTITPCEFRTGTHTFLLTSQMHFPYDDPLQYTITASVDQSVQPLVENVATRGTYDGSQFNVFTFSRSSLDQGQYVNFEIGNMQVHSGTGSLIYEAAVVTSNPYVLCPCDFANYITCSTVDTFCSVTIPNCEFKTNQTYYLVVRMLNTATYGQFLVTPQVIGKVSNVVLRVGTPNNAITNRMYDSAGYYSYLVDTAGIQEDQNIIVHLTNVYGEGSLSLSYGVGQPPSPISTNTGDYCAGSYNNECNTLTQCHVIITPCVWATNRPLYVSVSYDDIPTSEPTKYSLSVFATGVPPAPLVMTSPSDTSAVNTGTLPEYGMVMRYRVPISAGDVTNGASLNVRVQPAIFTASISFDESDCTGKGTLASTCEYGAGTWYVVVSSTIAGPTDTYSLYIYKISRPAVAGALQVNTPAALSIGLMRSIYSFTVPSDQGIYSYQLVAPTGTKIFKTVSASDAWCGLLEVPSLPCCSAPGELFFFVVPVVSGPDSIVVGSSRIGAVGNPLVLAGQISNLIEGATFSGWVQHLFPATLSYTIPSGRYRAVTVRATGGSVNVNMNKFLPVGSTSDCAGMKIPNSGANVVVQLYSPCEIDRIGVQAGGATVTYTVTLSEGPVVTDISASVGSVTPQTVPPGITLNYLLNLTNYLSSTVNVQIATDSTSTVQISYGNAPSSPITAPCSLPAGDIASARINPSGSASVLLDISCNSIAKYFSVLNLDNTNPATVTFNVTVTPKYPTATPLTSAITPITLTGNQYYSYTVTDRAEFTHLLLTVRDVIQGSVTFEWWYDTCGTRSVQTCGASAAVSTCRTNFLAPSLLECGVANGRYILHVIQTSPDPAIFSLVAQARAYTPTIVPLNTQATVKIDASMDFAYYVFPIDDLSIHFGQSIKFDLIDLEKCNSSGAANYVLYQNSPNLCSPQVLASESDTFDYTVVPSDLSDVNSYSWASGKSRLVLRIQRGSATLNMELTIQANVSTRSYEVITLEPGELFTYDEQYYSIYSNPSPNVTLPYPVLAVPITSLDTFGFPFLISTAAIYLETPTSATTATAWYTFSGHTTYVYPFPDTNPQPNTVFQIRSGQMPSSSNRFIFNVPQTREPFLYIWLDTSSPVGTTVLVNPIKPVVRELVVGQTHSGSASSTPYQTSSPYTLPGGQEWYHFRSNTSAAYQQLAKTAFPGSVSFSLNVTDDSSDLVLYAYVRDISSQAWQTFGASYVDKMPVMLADLVPECLQPLGDYEVLLAITTSSDDDVVNYNVTLLMNELPVDRTLQHGVPKCDSVDEEAYHYYLAPESPFGSVSYLQVDIIDSDLNSDVSEVFAQDKLLATGAYPSSSSGSCITRLPDVPISSSKKRYVGPHGEIYRYIYNCGVSSWGYMNSKTRSQLTLSVYGETDRTYTITATWVPYNFAELTSGVAVYRKGVDSPLEQDYYHFAASNLGPGSVLIITTNSSFSFINSNSSYDWCTAPTYGAPTMFFFGCSVKSDYYFAVDAVDHYFFNVTLQTGSIADLTATSDIADTLTQALPYKMYRLSVSGANALTNYKVMLNSVSRAGGVSTVVHNQACVEETRSPSANTYILSTGPTGDNTDTPMYNGCSMSDDQYYIYVYNPRVEACPSIYYGLNVVVKSFTIPATPLALNTPTAGAVLSQTSTTYVVTRPTATQVSGLYVEVRDVSGGAISSSSIRTCLDDAYGGADIADFDGAFLYPYCPGATNSTAHYIKITAGSSYPNVYPAGPVNYKVTATWSPALVLTSGQTAYMGFGAYNEAPFHHMFTINDIKDVNSLSLNVSVLSGRHVKVQVSSCDDLTNFNYEFECYEGTGTCQITSPYQWYVPRVKNLIVVVSGANAVYEITYRAGMDNCMALTQQLARDPHRDTTTPTFCPAALAGSTFYHAQPSMADDQARARFEELFDAFNCAPGDCNCRVPTRQCNNTLALFACSEVFRPCTSGSGLQTTVCSGLCDNVEEHCGTWNSVDMPELSCESYEYSSSTQTGSCAGCVYDGCGVCNPEYWNECSSPRGPKYSGGSSLRPILLVTLGVALAFLLAM
eukprot:TRINITY_DN113_c0_g1_i1.p1 TRINITY_DN113_c0_g1~~TRINITY_DN113_c0_g1_i1.p1  ORF type:complete len:2921 (+),score=725.06 TRINITY_DN113_c0_g1_i1:3596-12358(+)